MKQQSENRLDLLKQPLLWAQYMASATTTALQLMCRGTTSLNLNAATPSDMTSSPATRASSKCVHSHAARHWLPAQMAAALHRKVQLGETHRAVLSYINELSNSYKPHVLSLTALHRMYTSLPPSLRHPGTSSEGQLLQHIHSVQAAQRAERTEGQTMLTAVEEELLVQWTVREYNMNLPVTKLELKARARELYQQRTGLEWSGPLRNWYFAFMGRHPSLSVRQPENMSKVRLMAEKRDENIAKFFELLLPWKNLPCVQIYAADETGLNGDGSRTEKVIAPVGVKRVYRKSAGYYEHTSILHIANGAGCSIPSVWIFKGTKLDVDLAQQMEQHSPLSAYGAQENGYFTGGHTLPVFQHLVKYAVPQRPLLLIMDGASGHIDNASLEYAASNQIEVLLLPSHCTHLLQVADVAVFRAFKQYWRNECSKRRSEKRVTCGREDVGIKRCDIIPLAVTAWNHACVPENVISGFRRTGIYPYDPNAYKKTAASHTKSTSLTGCPSLLLSPSLPASVVNDSSVLAGLMRSPSLSSPSVQVPAAGAAPTKKVKRTLNLSAGMLLTAAQVREEVKRRDDEKEAEEQAKKKRKLDRDEKKAERIKEAAVKAVRKAEREAARAAVAAAKPPEAKKQSEKKAEGLGGETQDKENVSPNAPALVSAAEERRRFVCRVLRRTGGNVLRLQTCR